MASNQAAFNATVQAVADNLFNFNNTISSTYSIVNGGLSLGSQGINLNDITALGAALENNTVLNSLFLRYNSIGDAGASIIASVLQKSTPPLSYIHIGGNNIGDTGAAAVANALESNPFLIGLQLSDNVIGATGAAAFAKILKVNNVLSLLDLYNNRIGDNGAQALATALSINNSLTNIGLGQCQIGDTGTQAIATALQTNNSLINLSFADNRRIGDIGVAALANALKINTSLGYLELRNNLITDVGAIALINALQINYSLTSTDDLNNNSMSLANRNIIFTLTARNKQYIQFRAIYNGGTVLRNGANIIKISQGCNLAINSTNLLALGVNSTPITFNVTQIDHGEFVNATTRLPVTEFTQTQVNATQIEILHDGSYYPLSYAITASNGTVTTPPNKGAVIFTRQPNPPLLSKNNLTLIQNQTTIITTDNLLASFDGMTPLPGLIFNIANVTAGQFEYTNTTEALTSFPQSSVMNGELTFACDDSGQQPSCQIQVSDGNRTSLFVPANITFIPFMMTISTSQPAMTTTTQIPTSFTTTVQTPPPSIFTSKSTTPKPPTTLTTIPSSMPSTSLIPSSPQYGASKTSIPLIAGGGAAALAGIGLAWFLYRRKRQPKQIVLPREDNIIPMERNPSYAGVHLPDATTRESSVDKMPRGQTDWDPRLYDMQPRKYDPYDQVVMTQRLPQHPNP